MHLQATYPGFKKKMDIITENIFIFAKVMAEKPTERMVSFKSGKSWNNINSCLH